MPTWIVAAGALVFALSTHTAVAATGDTPKAEPPKTESTKADKAKADENRKKPLQRCDQLGDKAQQDCLEKARQRILEARNKRQDSAKAGEAKSAK